MKIDKIINSIWLSNGSRSIIDISRDIARISRFHCLNRFRSDLEFSRRGAVHQDERLEAPAETKREFVQSVVYTCRNTRAATSWPTITELTPTMVLPWLFTCYKCLFAMSIDSSIISSI